MVIEQRLSPGRADDENTLDDILDYCDFADAWHSAKPNKE